jgi:hypothetical protein
MDRYDIQNAVPITRKWIYTTIKEMMSRPYFLSGVINQKNDIDDYVRVKRVLMEPVLRPNRFIQADIMPRNIVSFDAIRSLDETRNGIKIQLSSNTLNQLLEVQIGDDRDISWISERARRLAAGESIASIAATPPFGRVQRTVTKKTSLGDVNNSISTQINTIQSAIASGTSNVDLIGAALMKVISNAQTSIDDLKTTATIASTIGIPRDWNKAGFTHRVWSHKQFKAEEGSILLFLLSNLPPNFDVDQRFLTKTFNNSGLQAYVRLHRLQKAFEKDMFLDIEERHIMTVDEAKQLIFNESVDGGVYDGPP